MMMPTGIAAQRTRTKRSPIAPKTLRAKLLASFWSSMPPRMPSGTKNQNCHEKTPYTLKTYFRALAPVNPNPIPEFA